MGHNVNVRSVLPEGHVKLYQATCDCGWQSYVGSLYGVVRAQAEWHDNGEEPRLDKFEKQLALF